MAVAQETPESDRLARLEATVDYLVREVGDIKVMMASGMSDVRTELREEIGGVRNEVGSVRNEIEGVRNEVSSVRNEMGSVRSEMGSVRNEMADIRVALREEMHIMQEAMEMLRQESRRDLRWIIGTFIGVMVPTWAFIAAALIVGLS